MRRPLRLRLAAVLIGVVAFLAVGELVSMVLLRVMFGGASAVPRKGLPTEVVRSPDESHERTRDWQRYRIVCIGDSCTYGTGLHGPWESYPAQLEKRLNAAAGGTRFEVINLGIGGHSSAFGLMRLREVVLPFRPDLVIASYGLNDKWRAETNDRDRLSAVHSTYSQALGAVHEVLAYSSLYDLLRLALKAPKQRFANLRVAYRVDLPSYRANLEAIARETRAAGAEIVFLAMAENPMIERQTKEGVEAFERHEYREAVRLLQPVVNLGMMYYPRPSHYLGLSLQALGQPARAEKALVEARQFAKVYPFPNRITVPLDRIEVDGHLDGVELEPTGHFDIYARYRAMMATVAAEEKAPVLDMTGRDLVDSDFYDYCHLHAQGYAKVVRELEAIIWNEVLPRQKPWVRPQPSSTVAPS